MKLNYSVLLFINLQLKIYKFLKLKCKGNKLVFICNYINCKYVLSLFHYLFINIIYNSLVH